jgi:Family of unknown function (DUF5681)
MVVIWLRNFAVASGRQVSPAPRGVEWTAGAPCPRQSAITRSAAASRRLHSRFKTGQSGNPRGPRPKSLPALLVDALNEKVVATIDGERREITKREAVVTQLVNESAGANLRATKMLIDMLRDIGKKAGPAPAEKNPFSPTDKEVVEQLIARLRRNMCGGCPWATQRSGLDSRPDASTGQTVDVIDL